MGVSTSEVSSGLPEGDPNASRPSDSSEVAPTEEAKKPDGCGPAVIDVPSLVIKLPSKISQEFNVDGNGDGEDCEGGFKTPTSADSKIPALTECPPAPRKRRSEAILNSNTPPKEPLKFRRLLIDLPSETRSLFAPHLLTSFGGEMSRRPKEGGTAPSANYEFFFKSHD